MENRPLIEVDNLSFKYRKEFAIKDITFSIKEGDFFAITGPNGGGKSTLIKNILGILEPQSGKINKALTNLEIGYVPQNTNVNLDFPITVLDVVLMGNGKQHNRKNFFNIGRSTFEIECAKNSLSQVGMQDFLYRKISDLSGGQRQRVFMARAICSHPKLLVLDEPTSSIDINGQKEIYKLLKELNKNLTILVVTHDLTVITNYANKVLYVNQVGFMHNLKGQFSINPNNEHFCEVELMQMLGESND